MNLEKESWRNGGFLARSLAVWAIDRQQRTGVLLLILLMLTVAVYRWLQFSANAAPPGSDGGQWLAFGHQFLGGEQIKAGFQFYPPIFPFFTKLVSLVIHPLITLKLLGILTSVLICVPVYLLLRTTLHPWASAILATTVAITPYRTEVLFFGGYPQLLGTAFLLLAVFFLLKGLNTGRKRWFLGAAVATVATIGSNALPALALALASCVILLVFFFRLRRESKSILYSRFRSALLWWLAPSAILSLPFIAPYLAYLFTSVRLPANPMGLTLSDILGWLNSAWRWEFILWMSVIITAVAFLVKVRAVMNRPPILTNATIAILVSGFAGFLLVQELRFIAFIEIGLVLTVGLLLNMFISIISRQETRSFIVASTLVILLVFVSAVGLVGYRRSGIAYYWYMVVDNTVLSAMEWLWNWGIPGEKVVATGAARGHNYGWWIEGYASLPTYMAGDPFLFFNVEERAQVALAQSLVLQYTTPEEVRALVGEADIQFLFLDKRVFHGSLVSFFEAGFVKRLENDIIIIMERETPALRAGP